MAIDLSAKTGLPTYHIDHFFFKAPNIFVPSDEAMQELEETLPDDNWIIEGNHAEPVKFLAERADHIIVLDVHPLICTYRIIKRQIQNDPMLRKAISEGWEETLSWQFIWFTLRVFPRNFSRFVNQIAATSKTQIYKINNARDIEAIEDAFVD